LFFYRLNDISKQILIQGKINYCGISWYEYRTVLRLRPAFSCNLWLAKTIFSWIFAFFYTKNLDIFVIFEKI